MPGRSIVLLQQVYAEASRFGLPFAAWGKAPIPKIVSAFGGSPRGQGPGPGPVSICRETREEHTL
eukprot:8246847-Alexandrium_andersonii.AAC.1